MLLDQQYTTVNVIQRQDVSNRKSLSADCNCPVIFHYQYHRNYESLQHHSMCCTVLCAGLWGLTLASALLSPSSLRTTLVCVATYWLLLTHVPSTTSLWPSGPLRWPRVTRYHMLALRNSHQKRYCTHLQMCICWDWVVICLPVCFCWNCMCFTWDWYWSTQSSDISHQYTTLLSPNKGKQLSGSSVSVGLWERFSRLSVIECTSFIPELDWHWTFT